MAATVVGSITGKLILDKKSFDASLKKALKDATNFKKEIAKSVKTPSVTVNVKQALDSIKRVASALAKLPSSKKITITTSQTTRQSVTNATSTATRVPRDRSGESATSRKAPFNIDRNLVDISTKPLLKFLAGGEILQAFKQMARAAIDSSAILTKAVADLKAPIIGIIKSFGELILKAPLLGDAFKLFVSGLNNVNNFLNNLNTKGLGAAVSENPKTALALGGAGIAGASFIGTSILPKIQAATAKAFGTILTGAETAAKNADALAKGLLNGLKSKFEGVPVKKMNFPDFFKNLRATHEAQAASDKATRAWSALEAANQTFFGRLSTVVSSVIKGVSTSIASILSTNITTFAAIWAAFVARFLATMNAIKVGFISMIASIVSTTKYLITALTSVAGFTAMIVDIGVKLTALWTLIKSVANIGIGGITQATAVLALLTTSFMTLMKSFELYKEANESAGQNTSLMDDIALGLDEFTGGIFNVTGLLEKVNSAFDSMFEAFDNMFSGLVDSYNGIIDKMSTNLLKFFDPEALAELQRIGSPQFISESRKKAREARRGKDLRLAGSENFGAGFGEFDLELDASAKQLKAAIKAYFDSFKGNVMDAFGQTFDQSMTQTLVEKFKKSLDDAKNDWGQTFDEAISDPLKETLWELAKKTQLGPDERMAPLALKGSVEAYRILNSKGDSGRNTEINTKATADMLRNMSINGVKLAGLQVAN